MIDAGELIPIEDMQFKTLAGYNPGNAKGEYFYSPYLADRVINFFNSCLTHVKGDEARKPFVLAPWQEEATRWLIGIVDKNGHRRFRNVYCEVPRKNGKSTWVAGLAVFFLLCDAEHGAEIYASAASRDQATILYDICRGMIQQNKGLKTACKINRSTKRILYGESFLKAIPADAHTAHGFNSHFVVQDELHSWKGRDLFDVLKTSTGARSQPCVFSITTAGFDRQSICWKLHDYAMKVARGDVSDDTFMPLVYTVDEKADFRDESAWKKANPNYGISLKKEYIKAQCNEAVVLPQYQNTFRRLHLNQWTAQATRWINMIQYRECSSAPVEFDGDAPIFGGLDLSSTVDVTAWCMLQLTDGGDSYRVKWHFFLPEEKLSTTKSTEIREYYRQWADEGFITLTPGARVSHAAIRKRVVEDSTREGVRHIGYDPWNAEMLAQALGNDDGFNVVAVAQTYKALSEPCKHLESKIAEKKFQHGGNPVADWMFDNVEVLPDVNGNIRPVKPQAESTSRIDGVVSLVIAGAVALEAPQEVVLDWYEDNEVEFV